MSYSTSSPPQRLSGANGGYSHWHYVSADAVTSVVGAGYFTNGDDLGMQVGDLVTIYDSNTGDGGIAFVTSVTAGGAAECTEYQAVTT